MAEVKVPEVGESITEVFIGSWLKNEGETVQKDEPLVEIETDKATLEVPAPVSGVLSGVTKQQGDSATVGEVIAQVGDAAAGNAAKDAESAVKADEAEQPPAKTNADTSAETAAAEREKDEAPEMSFDPEPGEATDAQAQKLSDNVAESSAEDVRIMPAAQRLLDEHGLSARDVRATGPGGRVLKEDVQRAVDDAVKEPREPAPQQAAPASTSSPTPSAPANTPTNASGDRQEETVPMSPLRRRIAERLVEAQANAALLTTFNEVDMSAVMGLRGEFKEEFQKRYEGTRLGFMSFFVKAVIDGLKQIPQLNAEIREQKIVYKNYFDIGVAVSSKKGLLVPVIRNAERLSFAELERTISDFRQARAGQQDYA